MQNKKINRIIALSLCLILMLMVFSPFANATITEDTNKGSIVVSGIETGVTVYAYQLITVNYDYTNDEPEATPYSWVDGVGTWVQENFSQYYDLEEFSKAVTSYSDTAEDFYSKLIAAIRNGNLSIDSGYIKEETAEGEAVYPVPDEPTGSVTFTDCNMGTYLILIENGYRIYTPSVVNLTPEYNAESQEWELAQSVTTDIKSSLPKLTKTIGDDGKVDNFSTEDDIPFTITADVPTYLEDSISKEYSISDKICEGLIINYDSITVYGQIGDGELEELTANDHYELTTENATRPSNGDPVDFLVDFDYDKISSYDKVVVKFTARLSQSDATNIGSEGNPNDAYLDYSNNPYDDGSYQTLEDKVIVYTYGIKVLKTDKSTGEALTGAKFSLSDGTDDLYFVKTADGVYYQAKSTDEGATQTLEVGSQTDNKGVLYLYGLDEGSYILTETEAPDGYTKSNKTHTITLTDEEPDGILDDANEGDASGIYSLTFTNSSEFQLPITGGLGTVIFATCGILFVGLGIIILVIVAKKSHKTE